jgi:hypothetical protein
MRTCACEVGREGRGERAAKILFSLAVVRWPALSLSSAFISGVFLLAGAPLGSVVQDISIFIEKLVIRR